MQLVYDFWFQIEPNQLHLYRDDKWTDGIDWRDWGKIMIELIEKLMVIAAKANKSDALIIEAAIDRINELEAKLSDYQEDITDWQYSVEKQMRRRDDDK